MNVETAATGWIWGKNWPRFPDNVDMTTRIMIIVNILLALIRYHSFSWKTWRLIDSGMVLFMIKRIW